MNFLAKQTAKNKLSDLKSKAKDSLSKSQPKSKIDWEDYNFPPFIKIYHFSMDEIEEPEREIVSKLYLGLLGTGVCFLMNFLVVIIGLILIGFLGKAVVFVVFNFFVWVPLAVFNFYTGVRTVIDSREKLLHFTISQSILIMVYLAAAFTNFGSFHGLFYIGYFFQAKALFGILCLLEAILWILLTGISGFALYKTRDFV